MFYGDQYTLKISLEYVKHDQKYEKFVKVKMVTMAAIFARNSLKLQETYFLLWLSYSESLIAMKHQICCQEHAEASSPKHRKNCQMKMAPITFFCLILAKKFLEKLFQWDTHPVKVW